ncbi:MAG: hypothetical protein IJO20_04910 [Ruminococcus sp.]|nr:hypothetical protein [Ruminococcus sp.]
MARQLNFLLTLLTVKIHLSIRKDEIDYSAPVILMTKALEYIGNILFKKLTKNTTPPNNIFHMYKDNNGWSEHITLGNIAYLFKNQEFLSGTNDIHKLISKDRIEALEGKTVIFDNNGNKEEFKNDINKNLNVMFKALKYIADNFRNQAAHSDLTPEQKYKKCRELVITTQHLLFVLLYIIEDGTILGD